MKVVAKLIDVVAYFDKDGVHPPRFIIDGKEGQVVVKVDRVVKKEEYYLNN